MNLRDLTEPAVFGAFDGATSVVGVMLTLTHHPHLVVPTALGVAAAGGVGMAAGSWLSHDRDTSDKEALAIGMATAVGTLLPVLPYLFASGWIAMALSAFILVLLGAAITVTRMKAGALSLLRAAVETYGVLVAVCVAVAICAIATGSSAG